MLINRMTGSLLRSLAVNKYMLFIGRAIVGAGSGLISVTAPMYVAESAPYRIRVRLVTMNQLFITIGIMLATICAGLFSYDRQNGWRYLFGLAGIPSMVQLVGFISMPETPRWLVKQGQDRVAREVLLKIRGAKDVEIELQDIRSSCLTEKQTKEICGERLILLQMLRTQESSRRWLHAACFCSVFCYYSGTIIKTSGITDTTWAIWIASMITGTSFLFTFVGLWLVDRVGRRILVIGSIFGVMVSLILLAVGFQLAASYSPPVNATCNSYSWCDECIDDRHCGYCWTAPCTVSVSLRPRTVPLDPLEGRCPLPENLTRAHDYCPTRTRGQPALFLMSFAPGLGPVPWTVNSEIYPLWARSTGNAVATSISWIANLFISFTFLTLSEIITKYGTFWLYTGITLSGIIFFVRFLPETKGKSLESIQELFGARTEEISDVRSVG